MRLFYRLVAALVFGLLMLAFYLTPVGRMLEREYGLPLLYAVRGDRPVPPEALIVGLDNVSVGWLNSLAVTWRNDPDRMREKSPRLAACLPDRTLQRDLIGAANINHIPRAVHACLLEVLTERNARLIVFDINFNKERQDDVELAAAIDNARNVLLFERISRGDAGMIERRRPIAMLEEAALGTMAFHIDSARGEIATGYLTRYEPHRALRAMPDKAWELYTGQALARSDNLLQPIWIYGPPRAVPTVRLRDLFDPNTADLLPDDLSDRVVFIGSSDPQDAGIDDHFPVPTSGRGNDLMGGVELAATAFLNRLHGHQLAAAPRIVEIGIVFGIAFLGGIAVLTQARWRLMATIAAISLGYLAIAVGAFVEGRLWLPVAVPVFLTVAVLSLAAVSVRYFFVRSLVGRLAPRPVAALLLDGTVADRRQAKTESATIMFTDLVGSTSMAERLSEVDYTKAINLYYDIATDVIEAHRGMVVEFMGDGIVCMFSESVTGSDHAARCCDAAKALIKRMSVQNAAAPEEMPELRLRIGINSGLTATGDIGARHRFNFKALGDVVNVAARLEQMGKSVLGGDKHVVLVSEPTRAEAGLARDDLERLGDMPVRGRAEPVPVYRLPVILAE